MMTDPTSFLAWAFEMGAPDVSLDYFAPILGDAAAALLVAEVFAPEHEVSEIPCEWCEDAGHPLPVSWRHERAQYSGICPEAGPVSVAAPNGLRHRFQRKTFLSLLATAAGVEHQRIRDLIPGTLFFLGEAKSGQTYWSVFIARGLGEPAALEGVLQKVRLGIGGAKGLILVEQLPGLPHSYQLSHRFVRFEDVFDWSEDGLEMRPAAVRQLLEGKARSPRPSSEAIAHEILRGELEASGALPKGKALENLVREHWPKDLQAIRRSQIYQYRGTFDADRVRNPENSGKPD